MILWILWETLLQVNSDFSEGASTQGVDPPPKFLSARKVPWNLLPSDVTALS